MERLTRHLRAIAAQFESATSEDRAEQLASRAVARARPPQAQARRAAGVLAGIAVFAFGFAGVGALADSSVPGEFLYPVDRAFEAMTGVIGVDTGGSEERLTEAIELLDKGDDVRAAELIDEAIKAASKETGLDGRLTNATPNPVDTPTSTVASGPIVLPSDTEDDPEIVAVAPPVEEPGQVLRLAAEALLSTVQEIKATGATEEAAGKLVEAAGDARAAADKIIVLSVGPPEETTTTTMVNRTTTTEVSPDSTTTTSVPGDESTTTTTLPDDSTTTTTVDGGSGSTTTTSEPGPIILPPQG